MADERLEKIASWLEQGLVAYGDGDTADAIRAWRKVLEVDPKNKDALDYVDTAERRDFPRADGGPGDRVRAVQQDVVGEARCLIAAEQFEESLELLQRAAEASEFCIELEATIELVRSNLFATYRRSIGDLSRIPTLVADLAEITKFNLPKDAGFLLSLVDGATSLDNLMTVSGMDAFEVLRTTKNLIDVGIVEMQS
jgi:tetratricopeptide (TPR) repeat protein